MSKTAAPEKPDAVGHWLSGAGGLSIALLIANLAEQPVPWSANSYYWLGWPLMWLVTGLVTRQYPHRAWRWPLSMAVGQVFAVILMGAGNVAPVALIYAILLSVPQFIIASAVSARMLARNEVEK